MEILSILPNLGIGVVAIVTLGYVSREFINHLKSIHSEHKTQLTQLHNHHLVELKEREAEMRKVEREVRENIIAQLSQNTHVMDRVMRVLDSDLRS